MGSTFSLAIVRVDHQARLRNLALLGGLVAWMLYTRFFWSAQALHATLPTCPFLAITGHPCPFCGGTRSFAYTWQGDLKHALALYPLGPLMFAGTLVAISVLFVALITDRTVAWRVPAHFNRLLYAAAAAPIALSWGLKLTLLPN